MAITGRTRKRLWTKSANRCSICKIELFEDNKGSEEFNIGEECHIISSKTTGPRHKPNLADYDLFDNLILLCRNHHKEIDELKDTYNEELLRSIKLNHEKWIQTTLNNDLNSQKNINPKFFTRITSGKELLNIVSDSYGYRTDYDEVENETDADYISGILQNLIEYGEMEEIYDKVKIGFQLNSLIKDLEEKGYYIFGEKGIEKMKFSNGKTGTWSIATLVIKKKDCSEIIKVDLNKNDKNAST